MYLQTDVHFSFKWNHLCPIQQRNKKFSYLHFRWTVRCRQSLVQDLEVLLILLRFLFLLNIRMEEYLLRLTGVHAGFVTEVSYTSVSLEIWEHVMLFYHFILLFFHNKDGVITCTLGQT